MTNPIPVLTVSQLNRQVRSWLENEMGVIAVEGEISNLSKPSSGHFYFTLKDASAQLRCVYFRSRHAPKTNNALDNGQQVLAQGRLSLYEARGDYQLIVEQVTEAGKGDLFRQFELLKTKLAALGLFEKARKKTFSKFPYVIGVVTSPTGAALRDVLITLGRRFPVADVIVYASEVQGRQAAKQLINAINQANQEKRCDVLILARGGGSIEDLWAFNDEYLAHSIAKSLIPIVTGVGHETDFTIADFVADFRAATPTAAAEAVTPDVLDLSSFFDNMQMRLITSINRFIQHKRLLLDHELQKISSPRQLIISHWQTLDFIQIHLHKALQKSVDTKRHQLLLLITRLHAKNPKILVKQVQDRLSQLEENLVHHIQLHINRLKQHIANQLVTLQAISPLSTLDRGYAIVTHHNNVLFDSDQVQIGDKISIRLAKGRLDGEVSKTYPIE